VKKSAGIALGVLKSVVEALTEGRAPLIAALIEKATDAGDFFTGALHATTEAQKPVQQIVATWFKKSRDDLVERRTKTVGDNELKLIEFELQLREIIAQEFVRSAERERVTPQKPKQSVLAPATRSLHTMNQRMQKQLRAQEKARTGKRGMR
jgi:hypothetical protein